MKNSSMNLKGTFKADIIKLRKNSNNRYVLIVELYEEDYTGIIKIDIHDLLLETSGLSTLSKSLLDRINSNLPSKVAINNRYGYWRIDNESYFLSDVLSKSL